MTTAPTSAAASDALPALGPTPTGYQRLVPPTFDSIADERAYRKRELAVAFRLFAKLGFAEGVNGHITVRDPENQDWFWVNPFGMSFNAIEASDLILVDRDGALLEGSRPVNPAAFAVHSRVHAGRPDVVAAAHSHSVYGKTFSSLGIALEPITEDACVFFEDHGLYDFRGVPGEMDEGERISTALGSHKAVILQNHGLLTVGESVAEAVWWFVAMERSCQTQLLAMAAGTSKPIDPDTARETRERIGTHLAGWYQARPLWDDIARSDPYLFD
jgi:ribulose-5-phosphate 4-epimerase/fuculose-1-phosphate aldolase